LLAALEALGRPLTKPEQAAAASRALLEERRQLYCEPVCVAWDGRPATVRLHAPLGAQARVSCHLETEDGRERAWDAGLADLPRAAPRALEADAAAVVSLPPLPPGYHRVHLELRPASGGIVRREVLVVSAPTRAYEPPPGPQRSGAFLPLYALRTSGDWGIGDYTSLGELSNWLAGQGGDVVATLPLLPVFLEEPFLPSPYSPVSRLFWSELHIDPRRAEGFESCAAAGEYLQLQETTQQIERLRAARLVDYRAQIGLRRPLLQSLATCAFEGAESTAVSSFLAGRPDVVDYARFRAVHERQQRPWQTWPEVMRARVLTDAAFDQEAFRYHAYCQYLAEHQLARLAAEARQRGQEFYLDLPVGSNPDGYDTWRFQGQFAQGVSVGAPPDALFLGGQDWGFPPLHPEAARRSGYDYWRRVLRHHLRLASVLRIDHVLGLHRLWWVPNGFPATDGVYVRYPAEELYAVLSLESHRHRATIAGENLGTAPRGVRRAMSRHRVYETYVLQFEVPLDAAKSIRPPPSNAFASLNTHDMPPFAGFLSGSDIQLRRKLGLMPAELVRREEANRRRQVAALVAALRSQGLLGQRQHSKRAVLAAAMRFLRRSRARYVSLNLEDAWLETEAQNLPGTNSEYENWRRKARLSLEEFAPLTRGRDAPFAVS
jgi:4-alpha-glucanotransferase